MTRYPTIHCSHCQLMRCFPGGATTCYEWPGSSCPPPYPTNLDYKPILTVDGQKWWDRDAGTWRKCDAGIDSLWPP